MTTMDKWIIVWFILSMKLGNSIANEATIDSAINKNAQNKKTKIHEQQPAAVDLPTVKTDTSNGNDADIQKNEPRVQINNPDFAQKPSEHLTDTVKQQLPVDEKENKHIDDMNNPNNNRKNIVQVSEKVPQENKPFHGISEPPVPMGKVGGKTVDQKLEESDKSRGRPLLVDPVGNTISQHAKNSDLNQRFVEKRKDVPDPYNELRHRHEHPDSAHPDARPPRKPLSNVPPEYQLDETFVLPSANVGPNGRPFLNTEKPYVSLTVIVLPGVKDCFFYNPVSNFEVSYQVIRGGGMDIGLFIKDPDGTPIVARKPFPDAILPIKVPPYFLHLPYAVCLDNRKASYGEKHVSLTIDLDLNWENPSEDERALFRNLQDIEEKQAESMELMEQWNSVYYVLDNLFGRLRRIEHLQQRSNNYGSADKALMEANLWRVTYGSVIQVLLMLSVACAQVMVIRSLFDSSSRLYRFWFGKRSYSGARC